MDLGGYTPLHEAAENNHLAICRLIMKSVSDKNPRDADGMTPLHYASQNGHLAVCLYILNNVKDKKSNRSVWRNHASSCCKKRLY